MAPFGLVVLFAAVTVLQAFSALLAPRVADRIGLIETMVGTHLPSSLLLIAVVFAPKLGWASVLLLARSLLSSVDVPTRQALVLAVVTPAERTSAAATTNAARYVVHPLGPCWRASSSSSPSAPAGGVGTGQGRLRRVVVGLVHPARARDRQALNDDARTGSITGPAATTVRRRSRPRSRPAAATSPWS